MTHTLTLLETTPLTPDTNQYVFTKPDGYEFTPGQATDLALDRDSWREEKRPFTFTSDPSANVLSFVIKSYDDHDGVTKRLAQLKPGDRVLIEEPWGAIEDNGDGIFIAGGAGITPFIGILRQRARQGDGVNSKLIFANNKQEDIIMRHLWRRIPGLETHFVLSEGEEGGDRDGRLDKQMLEDLISDWSSTFYLCGPPAMEDAVAKVLKDRGVSEDRIIREE